MNNVLFISNVNKPNNDVFLSKKEIKVSDLLTVPIEVIKSRGFKCYVGIDRKNAQEIDSHDNQIFYYCQKIYRNPFNLLEVYTGYKNIERLVKTIEFDFIFCTTPLGGLIGRLIGRKYNIKVIYEVHGFHFYKGAPLINWILYYPIEKYLLKYTDLLITINKEDYNFAKKVMHFNNTFYVHGAGVDFKQFDNISINSIAKRKELNIPENAFIVLSIGYLNKNKNHKLVLNCLSKINNNNIYYLVAGEGKLKKYLYNYSKKKNIFTRFKLLGYRNDIYELLKCCNLFVMPSFREGLPVSIMQACYAKTSILASNIRGINDILYCEDMFDVNNNDELTIKIKDRINKKVYNVYDVTCYSKEQVYSELDYIINSFIRNRVYE